MSNGICLFCSQFLQGSLTFCAGIVQFCFRVTHNISCDTVNIFCVIIVYQCFAAFIYSCSSQP